MIVVAVSAFGGAAQSASAAERTGADANQLAEGVGMGARPSIRVRRLQRVVARAGFDVGPTGIDGRFGPFTAAAVRRMQARHGLVADGIVGPKTRRVVAHIASRWNQRNKRRTRAGHRSRQRAGASRRTVRPTAPTRAAHMPSRPAAQTPTAPAHAFRPADLPRSESPVSAVEAAVIGVLLALAMGALALLAVPVLRRLRSSEPVAAGPDGRRRGESTGRTGLVGGYRASREHAPSGGQAGSAQWPAKGAPVLGYAMLDRRGIANEASLERIESLCRDAGWELRAVVQDEDAGDLLSRPGLSYALEEVAAGDARALIVADMQLLAPSLEDLAVLLERIDDAGAALIVPDLELNTATPEGRQLASTLVTLQRWQQKRKRRGGDLRALRTPHRAGGSSGGGPRR